MDNLLDMRQLDSPACIYPNHFIDNLSWYARRFWYGQVLSIVSNPDLFLLHPGYTVGLPTDRTGQLRPINASYYKQLSFRMYIDSVDPSDLGLQNIWTNGGVGDFGNPAKWAQTVLYKTYPGWNIYTIDPGAYTGGSFTGVAGTLPWSGSINHLRLDLDFSGMAGKTVMLDWVRLTPVQSYHITWPKQQTGSIAVALDITAVNDLLCLYHTGSKSSSPLTIPASAGSYDLPNVLPAGPWTAEVSSGSLSSTAAGSWQVHAPPILSFTKPTFSGGVLMEVSNAIPGASCGGPWSNPNILFLDDNYWSPTITMDPSIDTQKFHCLTFRVKLDGTPDVSFGWVSRWIWSHADSSGGFINCGVTKPIPLPAGWNDISLDLLDMSIVATDDPCQSVWASQPLRQQLVLHPTENPNSTRFYVGDVKVTGADTVVKGQPYNVTYSLGGSQATNITFYYSTTRDGNGRVRAAQYNPITQPGPFREYLPIVQASPTSPSNAFLWDTGGVTPGQYYLSADVSNGYMVTIWYSDIPVVIAL